MFGKDLYNVEGHYLISGHLLLNDDLPIHGAGEMTVAWREAGRIWEAVSSRIVCMVETSWSRCGDILGQEKG